MKKIFLKALTVLMAVTLAGCGSAGNNGQTAAGSASGEGGQTAQADNSGQAAETAAPAGSEKAAEKTTAAETSAAGESETVKPEETSIEGLSLKELFAEHGMKAGTCLSSQMIDDPDASQLILDQFNSVTMENSMKPDYILNQTASQSEGRLVVEFNQDAVKMMEWAKENGLAMRGHTLVWYSQTPEWIFHKDFDNESEYVDRDEMLSRMEDMISQVFGQLEELGYLDIFYAYDVVNEAWMEDGKLRQNHWSEIIGDDYLWYAFFYADKYAPESIDLYYNDYNEQYKTLALYNFVNTLVDEDGRYLIDGIGLQAHLYTSDDLSKYLWTVEKLGSTGLKLELTELDVCLGRYQSPLLPVDENTQSQGRFYYDLINGLFERADAGLIKMDALTFWGFSDGMSWRKEYSPLLFNASLKPKYAFFGAMQMKEKAGY